MPRDYAKDSKRKERGQLPGWAWMLGGLVIGLFVAFLVYLNNNTSMQQKKMFTETFNKEVEQVKQTQQKQQNRPANEQPVKDAQSEQKKPRFDFYTILPELEVAIPDQELAKVEEKEKQEQTQLDPKAEYILQAGSFRDAREADRLKARLALQGIEAEIQTVEINQGDTWHRVRVGPMKDISAVNRTRQRLQQIGIPAIVVKSKG